MDTDRDRDRDTDRDKTWTGTEKRTQTKTGTLRTLTLWKISNTIDWYHFRPLLNLAGQSGDCSERINWGRKWHQSIGTTL
jgi:hypothetical protein